MGVEVELDIFSGRPNPTWVLTGAEAEQFVRLLAALPRTSGKELSGNLGYRGFIVQAGHGAQPRLIRIQNGLVHISEGSTTAQAVDEGRELERWLLQTGAPHLKNNYRQLDIRWEELI